MLSMYLSVLETQEDKDLFEEIYRKYKGSMGKFSFSILHNKEDVEDAVNDAFLCIANNFTKIKSLSCQDLKSYLIIIIRNASLKIYNNNKKRSDNNEVLDGKEIPVDVDFFSKMEYEAVISIMSKLPLIYRDVMFLYYRDELSTKEIAKMLSITESVVYKRIERSKKMLAAALEKGGYDG